MTTATSRRPCKIAPPPPARLIIKPQMPRIARPKAALFASMTGRTQITLQDHCTRLSYTGIVNQITVEDGSGSSFIVTLHSGTRLYHRTID